ncbi:MAG: UDP-N-acetylmuramoyl-L-alanyl-D-glutamate--2,6-diaminopimelate ligase [Clostridia bacterium]|nr:UDP-N-acetylmuramoyl-L-alanyl-D-glutamate--2,6-diaminopimelate ligase [Clostridia bacterium]
MKARELLFGIELLEVCASLEEEISAVVTDTRAVKRDALFVCIAGTKFDSHTAAAEVFANGAALLVSEQKLEGVPYVLVADTHLAVSRIYANLYGNPERKFSHVIGITGTNGKTSTSMMARRIFEAAGHKVGLIGTTKYVVGDKEYDAPMTTPAPQDLFRYFAEMIDAGCDTLIMEVSSHSLSQKRVEGIDFTVGVFTNLTQDHLDYHGTMENYRREKEKLFSVCRQGVINLDDPSSAYFFESAKCPAASYGCGEADFAARDLVVTAFGVEYRFVTPVGEAKIAVPIPGKFSAYNSMAAAASALLSGIDLATVAQALSAMPGVPGRVERQPNTGSVSVLIDYAHTPDALLNVLLTLNDLPHGRIITLFGCGGDRDPKKRPIMGRIACENSDLVIVTSDNPRTEEPEDIIRDILAGCDRKKVHAVITDRTEAIRRALTDAEDGDVILLAGKGHEEYVIDKTGKHPYSEKAIVADFYAQKKGEKTC